MSRTNLRFALIKSIWRLALCTLILFCGFLHAETRKPGFERSLSLMMEMNTLAGLSVQEQIRRLPSLLTERYGFRVDCDPAFFSSVDDFKCLLGMRRLARLFYSGLIGRPPEIINLYIGGSGAWTPFDPQAQNLAEYVPFDATASDLVDFLRSEINSPKLRERQRLAQAVHELSDEIQRKTGKRISLYQIPFAKALQALYRLQSLIPLPEPSSIEEIRLGSSFVNLHEYKQTASVMIDTAAAVEDIRKFLEDQGRATVMYSGGRLLPPAEFSRQRDELDRLRDSVLQTGLAHDVQCSTLASLSVRDCASTLSLFSDFLRDYSPAAEFDLLLVVDKSESPAPVDQFTDPESHKSLLILRTGSSEGSLESYFSMRGWIQSQGGQP